MANSKLAGQKLKNEQLNQHILFSKEELLKKVKLVKNASTKKSEDKADRAFTKFLSQLGATDLNYWISEESELKNHLTKFWLGLHKYMNKDDIKELAEDSKDKMDKLYSRNTLQIFWYALNRILKEKGHLYNTTTKGA